MNRKHIRTLSTLLLAIAMIFTMGMSVFAEEGIEELGADNSMITQPTDETSNVISKGGVKQNGEDVVENGTSTHGDFTALKNTVRIDKEIIIFNTRAKDTIVYLPNVKYNYAIAPVDVPTGAGTKHNTDEYNLSGTIYKGEADALTTTSADVSFSNTAGIKTGNTIISNDIYVTTKTSGVAAAGYFDISFNPAKFARPGIYRYKITESEDSTLTRANAGVIKGNTEANYKDDRFLDVYVKNNAAGTSFDIYGYVLYEGASDDSFSAKNDNGYNDLTAKTNGFVSNKNDDSGQSYSSTEDDVDLYLTSNVKIMKKIEGAMGDKGHEFPFQAVIHNETITSDPIISYQELLKDGVEDTSVVNNPVTMTGGTATIGAADADSGIKLKDQEFLYVYGIPGKNAASTVQATEFNDTTDVYSVSAKYNTEAKKVQSEEKVDTVVTMDLGKTAAYEKAQTINISEEKDDVEITNKLNSISPTNVVMRFAPYLFILGGAMMLLVTSRRRKAEQE